jgi:parallel beta-helix repeat protein
MTYLDAGFNYFLERPVPKAKEQSEFDAESIISGLPGSSIVGGKATSLTGGLGINLDTGRITQDDGRLERRILPSPSIIVDQSGDGDFANVQEAVNYAQKIGGATLFIKNGTYYPDEFITLYNNIYLIGQDTEQTIIDFSGANLDDQFGFFASGDFVSIQGTVSTTNNSNLITGVDTLWETNGVRSGDTIFIAWHPYEVAQVNSDISLQLKETWEGANVTTTNAQVTRPKSNIFLENMTLRGVRSGANGGVSFRYCNKVGAHRVKATDFNGTAFDIGSSFNFVFSQCEAKKNTIGFRVLPYQTGDLISKGVITNCTSWNNSSRGVYIGDNSIVSTTASTIYGNDLGIRLDGERCYVGGCAIETNNLDGIRIVDGQSNQIVGNYINSNGQEGINIQADAITSDDNKIIGNEISLNGDYGVVIEALCSRNRLSGNTIRNNTTGNVSDGGTGTIRDVRFVPIDPRAQVLNTNPGVETYADLDVTANTSANTFMVIGTAMITSGGTDDQLRVRKNGSSDDGNAEFIMETTEANVTHAAGFQVEVDSGQVFEWRTSDQANVSNVRIVLTGYWEYVD